MPQSGTMGYPRVECRAADGGMAERLRESMNSIKLINGNCLEEMAKLPEDSVDLIVTDPPYNLGNFMRARDTNLKEMRDNFFGEAGWDDLDFGQWLLHMTDFFVQAKRVLKKGGSMIVFMSVIKVESILAVAEKCGLYYKTTGIWHKTNPMPRNMNLHFINSVEAWIYFTNVTHTGTFRNGGKALHDFIESPVAPKKEKQYGGHPTQKPERVMQHFVETLSNPGDVVMDPFMGSGTTGVVSKRTGRSFVGIELQPDYFQICLKRMADELNGGTYETEVINEVYGNAEGG